MYNIIQNFIKEFFVAIIKITTKLNIAYAFTKSIPIKTFGRNMNNICMK